MLQILVLANHHDGIIALACFYVYMEGKDTHVRQIKVYSPGTGQNIDNPLVKGEGDALLPFGLETHFFSAIR